MDNNNNNINDATVAPQAGISSTAEEEIRRDIEEIKQSMQYMERSIRPLQEKQDVKMIANKVEVLTEKVQSIDNDLKRVIDRVTIILGVFLTLITIWLAIGSYSFSKLKDEIVAENKVMQSRVTAQNEIMQEKYLITQERFTQAIADVKLSNELAREELKNILLQSQRQNKK